MWTEIKSDEDLPPEGKWVLAHHNKSNWRDQEDPENVHCVVVKLVKGITMEQRAELVKTDPFRALRIYPEDQHDNNIMPYCWKTFGPGTFFGHEITHWQYIEPLKL